MKKTHKTLPFEIDFKTRLEQSRAASDAVRLPRLGYNLYRVYNLPKKKHKPFLNGLYGSGSTGTSTTFKILKTRHNKYSKFFSILYKQTIHSIEDLTEITYKVEWLKPKHVTLLELKGHLVKLAKPGDKSIKIKNTRTS